MPGSKPVNLTGFDVKPSLRIAIADVAVVRESRRGKPRHSTADLRQLRSLMGQGREPLPNVDASGCLRSLRARSALDGVSWVRCGLVSARPFRNRCGAPFCSTRVPSSRSAAGVVSVCRRLRPVVEALGV
jgi:hypothetical protein